MLQIILSIKNQKTTDLIKDNLIKNKNIYLIIKRFSGSSKKAVEVTTTEKISDAQPLSGKAQPVLKFKTMLPNTLTIKTQKFTNLADEIDDFQNET